AVATVGGSEAAAQAVESLSSRLTADGQSVFLVDLSEAGLLGREAAPPDQADACESGRLTTRYRPEAVPALSRGPVSLSGGSATLPDGADLRRAWENAEIVVTLAEVDPAVGVDGLKLWADHVVVVVKAGRSDTELLRTVAELIKSADLKLLFAMLTGSDRTDSSLGIPEIVGAEEKPARR